MDASRRNRRLRPLTLRGEVPRRRVGDGRLVGLLQVVVFLKGSWDWAGPLQDHSEGARGWLMDPLAAPCAGFSVD